jgi:hypothetical protein
VESLSPITPRKGSLDKQSVDDIANRMNDTFNFTIMWGHVRTRHSELCVVQQEEDPGGRVIKLTPVVALDRVAYTALPRAASTAEVVWCVVPELATQSWTEVGGGWSTIVLKELDSDC